MIVIWLICQFSKMSYANAYFSEMEPDTSDVVVHHSDSADSVIDRLSSLYNNFRKSVLGCQDLLKRDTAGQMVASNEFKSRLSAYELVFPNVKIDHRAVRKEIVIERILKNEMGIVPSEIEIQVENEYQKFVSVYPLATLPSKDALYPIIQNKIFLSSDDVVRICSQIALKEREETRRKRLESMKPWSVEKLALNIDRKLCLVSDTKKDECIITVADFNGYLAFQQIPSNVTLKVARDMVLRKLLKKRYIVQLIEDSDIVFEKEFLEEQEKQVGNKLIRNLDTDRSEIPGKERLKEVYDKYYDRFFRDRRTKKVGILGSTDSFYIDSIYRILRKFDADPEGIRATEKKRFILSLPMAVSVSDELPDSMFPFINNLRNQHYDMFSTPFGFFICRIVSEKRHFETPIDEAVNELRYLIREEKARSKGKTDSARAIEYYRENNEQFLVPDTMVCRVWLVPLIDTLSFKRMDEKSRLQILVRDTSSFNSKIIASYNLPSQVAVELSRIFREMKGKKGVIGPISGPLGTWYFLVEKVISGNGKLPFESVRETILRDLEIRHFPLDSIGEDEVGASLLKQESYVAAYRASLWRETENLSDAKVLDLIDNKTIKLKYDNGRKIDRRLLDTARRRILDKKIEQDQKKTNEWIKTLAIDRALLFTGCDEEATDSE